MRGASAMQPAAPGHDKTDRVALRKGAGVDKSEAVNAERFWKMQEEEVPPEQVSSPSWSPVEAGACSPLASLSVVFPSLLQFEG